MMRTLLSLAFVCLIHFLGGIRNENTRSNYFNMIPQHRLTGHLLTTTTADADLTCAYKCLHNERCRSCNFKAIPQKVGICELNSRTLLSQTYDPALIHDKSFVFINDDSDRWPDCAAMRKSGVTTSGIYSIDPDGKGPMKVYCDMTTDGGGWTVIQRRINGSVDFDQDWASYKQGFGTTSGELWLGNDKIHRLTAGGNTVLRIELEDWDGNTAYVVCGTFEVGDESNKYRLTVGDYSGSAGDSLTRYTGMLFSTKDRDNDIKSSSCAIERRGAWWYKQCAYSNLNGLYMGNTEDNRGMYWYHWKNSYLSMKRSVMMVKP